MKNRKKKKNTKVQDSLAMEQVETQDLSTNNMEFFYHALSLCIPKDCPAVIVVKQLSNGGGIHWQREGKKYIALLAEDIPDIEKLNLVMAGPPSTSSPYCKSTIASSCPMYSGIYRFASFVSKSLSIDCPQILVLESDVMKNTCGVMLTNENGMKLINVNDALSPENKIRTIAHEMRHAWQRITNPEYFLADYIFPGEYGLDEYAQQIAEVDAEAFSRAFCHLVFGTPIQINRFSAETDQLINDLAEKMVASPLDYGISVPGGSGGQKRPSVA